MATADLSLESLSGLMWTLTAATVPLTVGRYLIRYQVRRRLYWDDFTHGLAVICLFAFTAIAQSMFVPASEVVGATPGEPPSAAAIVYFRKLQLGLDIVFFTGLWLVKFSFLFFYRLLFWVDTRFRKAWWTVVAFTFVGYWVPIAGKLTECGTVQHVFDQKACTSDPLYQRQVTEYICGVHVAIDVIILLLPCFMIHQLRLPRAQKVGLVFLFSMVLVTMALDILRSYESLNGGTFSNSIVEAVLEATFAVIVSCLPTYRALVGLRRKVKGDSYVHWSFRGRSGRSKRSDAAPLADTDGTLSRSSRERVPVGKDGVISQTITISQHVAEGTDPWPLETFDRTRIDSS